MPARQPTSPASPTRASSSSDLVEDALALAQVARRERRRRRGVRRRRPVGVGAQGRDRERRAQPRQVDRHHGLRRPAPRQRQHVRLLARRARADGARGARHRPLHRRGSGRRACPTPTTSPPATRRRATSTCSIPGRSTPRRRSSWRGAARRRRSRSIGASPIREGAGVSAQQSHFYAGNTRGFGGGYAELAPFDLGRADRLAAGRRRRRHAARRLVHARCASPDELAAPEAVGRYAAERALSRLASRKIKTCEVPVLFESSLAVGPARRLRAGDERRRAVPQVDASCSTASASACCPSTSTSARIRTCRAARAARRSTTKACATRPARRRRRRRRAELLPVDLLGAQARHAHDRPRRRLAQPDADVAADRAPATTSTRCCASSAAACS